MSDTQSFVISDDARSARKYLLATSVIFFLMESGGIKPSKIAFLGVSIDPSQSDSILNLVFICLLYFMVNFIIVGLDDLFKNVNTIIILGVNLVSDNKHPHLEGEVGEGGAYKPYNVVEKRLRKISRLISSSKLWVIIFRVLLEFLFPIIVGLYLILWHHMF